jgi:hypothetical protein
MNVTLSPSLNGYHIELWCQQNCDLCRLVFDDQTRYSADIHNRPTTEQNVFFFQKQKTKCLNIYVRSNHVRG